MIQVKLQAKFNLVKDRLRIQTDLRTLLVDSDDKAHGYSSH